MKKLQPHFFVLLGFIMLSCIYFYPSIEGRELQQSDIISWKAMSKEIADFRKDNGEEALWTNTLFSGMPAYQISLVYENNFIRDSFNYVTNFIPTPILVLLISLIGFYILFVTLKISPLLAFAGAIACSFTSYFFIIIEAGHITKAYAIAYIPVIVAGFLLTYNKKYSLGLLLFGLSITLQLGSNHLQITYYLMMILVLAGIYLFIDSLIKKEFKNFFISTILIIGVALLSVGTQSSNLLLTNEYAKETMRGGTELKANESKNTSGLDIDYATAWSYGKMETFNLLAPNFMGGASGGPLDQSSETYKTLISNNVPKQQATKIIQQLPLYWGAQPFTSGPTYIGAISCFLFILAFFVVDKKWLWAFVPVTILSIMLSWGKNFPSLTNLFFDYLPFYSKFRTVAMTLVIASFTIPFLGILTLYKLTKEENNEKILKYLKYAGGIIGAILLFFIFIGGSLFNFESPADTQLPEWLRDSILSDRKSIMQSDLWRSFFLIVGFVAAYFFYLKNKITKQIFLSLTILLFIIDLWSVNKRYLNDENYEKRKRRTEFTLTPTDADLFILQDKDPNYRVLNLSVNTFNDATTSYFHKSVGGYHGAKLARYQDLIDEHLSKGNISVLNMLNTKYVIQTIQDKAVPQTNSSALGNAWFVNETKMVANPDSELMALKNFNPKTTAIVDVRFKDYLTGASYNGSDSSASIKLTNYSPKELTYRVITNSEQLAIFSEIYYEKGWNAYIDGKLVPHIRANYVLRALRIPKGNHEIKFKFEPKLLFLGQKITLISSITLILLFVFLIIKLLQKKTDGDN